MDETFGIDSICFPRRLSARLLPFPSSYLFFCLPQSWALQRFHIGKWMGINVLVWGVALFAHAACQSFAGLLVCRLILGACEGASSSSSSPLSLDPFICPEGWVGSTGAGGGNSFLKLGLTLYRTSSSPAGSITAGFLCATSAFYRPEEAARRVVRPAILRCSLVAIKLMFARWLVY